MDDWPRYVPWSSGPISLLFGPLLGLGVWWAEGPSARQKPRLSPGSEDDLIWEANYPLNRLLLGLVLGSGVTFAFATLQLGLFRSPIDFAGGLLCGFLVVPLAFWVITRPRTLARYEDFRRFYQLRYGYKPEGAVVLASVLAFAWLLYVLLRV